MSVALYTCKICQRKFPARDSKDYGFCRYCGQKNEVNAAMRMSNGKSDSELSLEINDLDTFADVFADKCALGIDVALDFVRTFAEVKKNPDFMYAIYKVFDEQRDGGIPEDTINGLCVALLDSAAKSKAIDRESWKRANEILADAYCSGNRFGLKKDSETGVGYYYNLAANADLRADAFYNMYLNSESDEEKEAWLSSAAYAGHPLAISKTRKSSTSDYVPPCEYMIGGACTKMSNSLVIVSCHYFERGECQAHCMDYRPRV